MFDDITKAVLLSDMDGTLLTADKRISDVDRDAIRRFTELGGRFTVATGRTIQSFEQYRAMIDLPYPVVMFNGAAIHDFSLGKTLYTQPLPEEAKAITSRIMELMPDLGGEVLRAEGTYVFSNTPYEQLHTKLCNIVPEYMELSQIPEGGWLKVLFSMAPEDVPHLQLLVSQMELDTVSFVKSSEIFFEMMPLGVSKGSALRQFRKLPGWEDCSFAAIGDFDNDIEMIQAADLGACPANAENSVKAAADLVLTRTNEEGAVAELIDHIIERCGA
ncbi:MAG: HAD family hydrolase [Ruminococcus sp.]|nr:HAD family hydrolase [Ruminococcus sp.]